MFNLIIKTSIHYRYLVLIISFLLGLLGFYSYKNLIIDAVPDITNIQVQINTEVSGYSPYEVEQRVSQPIELLLAGLPALEYTRSLSRYGLSQVTVVFKDGTDIYFARQLISQRLQESGSRLPADAHPAMGPIATGLGEIFMYTVENLEGHEKKLSLQQLRETQDWLIKPQLRTVPGVIEINSIGGASKEIVVTPNIEKLRAYELTLNDLSLAIARNNSNVGAGFIEQNGEQFLIRVPAQVSDYLQINQIVIAVHEGTPIKVQDLAEVTVGSELRTGAATENGREVVLGTVFMLMGENGRDVAERVELKIQDISKSLPEGVIIKSVYNRSNLVNATIDTVRKNLVEGALLVVAILFAMLGNLRAALITACIIPLSMLFTIFGMAKGGLSANLMSLGALDFGLIVDGAVILVENCISRIGLKQNELGRKLNRDEHLALVNEAAVEVRQATMFGELIIMIVYIPILALTGIEGKMYHPMAYTVLLALGAAFILSLTFIPAAVAVFLTGRVKGHIGLIDKLQNGYRYILSRVIKLQKTVIFTASIFFLFSIFLFQRLGSEFIPTLDEGDIALHALRIPGTSLTQAINMQYQLEDTIKKIPEVSHVFAKIGTAEIATDPMPPSVADGFIMLKPRAQWENPKKPKQKVISEIEALVTKLPGNNYEFTQPIQMRFNELIAGVRSDLAIKVFGSDNNILLEQADLIKTVLEGVEGAADVKVEQITGLPMITVTPKRSEMDRLGLSAADIQSAVKTAYAGEQISTHYEEDRSFPVVLRLAEADRFNLDAMASLPIALASDLGEHKHLIERSRSEIKLESVDRAYVTLGEVAEIAVMEGPNQISRENGKRRIIVSANVRNRDLGSFVKEVQNKVEDKIKLPANYWLSWGGQYEHLISAQERLYLVVPIVLCSVFILIFITFRSVLYTLLVFTGVPFALSGGVFALWLRDIPFSISAAVGFIALCGVSVLNSLVLVSFIKNLYESKLGYAQAIIQGATSRLRPVLMTALVASLGFLPMAISQGIGSEVQRPLATVVIGGIISSTALTLLVLPVLLSMFGKILSSDSRNER